MSSMMTATTRPCTSVDGPSAMTSVHSATAIGFHEASKTPTEKRRRKLIALRDRERMKDVLIRKFQNEYDSEGPDGTAGQKIAEEVKNFVNNAKVTEANLHRLEKRIRNHDKSDSGRSSGETKDGSDGHEEGKKTDEDDDGEHGESDDEKSKEGNAVSVSNYSALSLASTHSQLSKSSSCISTFGRKPKVPPTDSREMTDYDWGRLDDYANFLYQRDQLRIRMEHKEQKDKMRADLSRQMQERLDEEMMQKQENNMYVENAILDTKMYQDEERMKQEIMKEKNMELKRSLDAQVELDKREKQAAFDEQREFDKQLLQKLCEELTDMNSRDEQRRTEEKNTLWTVFHQHDRKVRNAKIQEKEEKKNEYKQCRDFQKLLDDRDAAAKAERDYWAKSYENSAISQKAEIDRCAHAARSPSKEQALFSNQFKEIDDFAQKKEDKVRDKLSEMMHETQTFLIKQMEEKKEKMNQLDMLERIRGDIIFQDIENYNTEEKQKSLQRRLQNIDNRLQIQKQIQTKASRIT